MIKPNFRRSSPLLLGIQETYSINPSDGLYGPVTGKALDSINVVMSDIPIEYRIAEVISLFEMGNCRNVWYARSEVPEDGAGTNYGFLQVNKYGSLQAIKEMCPYEDVETFFSSPMCVQVQWEYFLRHIVDKVVRFGFESDRDFLMKCDVLTQHGSLIPAKAPKTWQGVQLDAGDVAAIQEYYRTMSVREAFLKAISTIPGAYCELRPISGSMRWLEDSRSRRRTCYHGFGKVHGELYDLSLFGF